MSKYGILEENGLKRCLILITSSYPFLTQESFLESEIPYLQKGFDKIITLAIDIGKDAKKMRATPENADCYNIATQKKVISRTESKIFGAVNYLKGSDYSDEDRDADNFKRKMFLEYFSARAEREYKMCRRILDKYDFSQYDSITVYSYWFFVAALIGVKIKEELSKKCSKVKLISRAHGYDVYENVNALNYLPLRPYLLNKVDALFPCSINGEEHIKKKYPVFDFKIKHSYLGTPDAGTNKASENGLHIVSCSRAVPLKRIDKIAKGLALLKDSGIENLKWTHIGDGPELDRVKKIADEKLGFMAVDFKGNMSNTDVLKFYRKTPIDLFINVSNTEGLPISIMEAISFGIPVVATDVGGVSEIVKNNYNGRLLDVDFSDNDFAHRIRRFYSASQEDKQKFRQNAREYWEQNFNADKNYSEFTEKIK